MKLTFLGTRGGIDARSDSHDRQSCLLLEQGRQRLLIDCGEDWLEELPRLRADAVLVTHAHFDHAFGLQKGSPCPVWATEASWQTMADYPIARRHTVRPRRPLAFGDVRVEAFSVRHSLRAPAVGYRISDGTTALFYAPDLVGIDERRAALAGCRIYIGDGTAIEAPLVRQEEGQLCGHTSVETQLSWCAEEGVPAMIVTHCGEELVHDDAGNARRRLDALARRHRVEVTLAHDGMEFRLS